ncbi:hypothetical protein CCMA1212_003601 [Trichoderma ghanense]|uniref:Uncharacterized protein n=1 Tax=Trichoderma ghanense TaxID=65468 RepID=A0ABY2H6Q8_9HYPO
MMHNREDWFFLNQARESSAARSISRSRFEIVCCCVVAFALRLTVLGRALCECGASGPGDAGGFACTKYDSLSAATGKSAGRKDEAAPAGAGAGADGAENPRSGADWVWQRNMESIVDTWSFRVETLDSPATYLPPSNLTCTALLALHRHHTGAYTASGGVSSPMSEPRSLERWRLSRRLEPGFWQPWQLALSLSSPASHAMPLGAPRSAGPEIHANHQRLSSRALPTIHAAATALGKAPALVSSPAVAVPGL